MEARALADELNEHGDRAVGLRARLRKQAVADLALNHDAPEPDIGETVEALDDQRGGDVVRQVGDELRRVARQLDVERVPEGDVDVVAEVAQTRRQRAVDLDRVYVPDAR